MKLTMLILTFTFQLSLMAGFCESNNEFTCNASIKVSQSNVDMLNTELGWDLSISESGDRFIDKQDYKGNVPKCRVSPKRGIISNLPSDTLLSEAHKICRELELSYNKRN